MIQKKATGPPSFIFTKSSIKESLKIPFCGTIIKQFRSNQEDLVLYPNQTKSKSKPEHLSLYPYQNYFPSKSEDQMYLCNKSSRSNPEPPPPIPFTKWNLTVFHRPRSLPLNKPRLSYFRPRQGGHSPTHTKKKTPDDSSVWIYKTPAARQRPRTGTTHTTGRRYGLVRALLVPALSLDTLISLRWEPGRQILHGEL